MPTTSRKEILVTWFTWLAFWSLFCFFLIAKEITIPGKEPSSKTDCRSGAHSQAGGVPEVITSPLPAVWGSLGSHQHCIGDFGADSGCCGSRGHPALGWAPVLPAYDCVWAGSVGPWKYSRWDYPLRGLRKQWAGHVACHGRPLDSISDLVF